MAQIFSFFRASVTLSFTKPSPWKWLTPRSVPIQTSELRSSHSERVLK